MSGVLGPPPEPLFLLVGPFEVDEVEITLEQPLKASFPAASQTRLSGGVIVTLRSTSDTLQLFSRKYA